MGEWARPNDFFVACRLTSSKYADSFLDTGSIKFNTPNRGLIIPKNMGMAGEMDMKEHWLFVIVSILNVCRN